eukprot:UN28904
MKCYKRLDSQAQSRKSTLQGDVQHHRDTNTLFGNLMETLKIHARKLDNVLEVFGRPILDVLCLYGKEAKASKFRQTIDQTEIGCMLAIFIHTLEEIVNSTDSLIADLENIYDDNQKSFTLKLGETFKDHELLFEHYVKYAERLPFIQDLIRVGGALHRHTLKCEKSDEFKGERLQQLLNLPGEHLPALEGHLKKLDKTFCNESHANSRDLKTCVQKLTHSLLDMNNAFRASERGLLITKKEKQFSPPFSSVALRGRQWLKEAICQVRLDTSPFREMMIHILNDIILFSAKSALLHKVYCGTCLVTRQMHKERTLQIINGTSCYTVVFSQSSEAKDWCKTIE